MIIINNITHLRYVLVSRAFYLREYVDDEFWLMDLTLFDVVIIFIFMLCCCSRFLYMKYYI